MGLVSMVWTEFLTCHKVLCPAKAAGNSVHQDQRNMAKRVALFVWNNKITVKDIVCLLPKPHGLCRRLERNVTGVLSLVASTWTSSKGGTNRTRFHTILQTRQLGYSMTLFLVKENSHGYSACCGR